MRPGATSPQGGPPPGRRALEAGVTPLGLRETQNLVRPGDPVERTCFRDAARLRHEHYRIANSHGSRRPDGSPDADLCLMVLRRRT